ncbi:MAG: glycosyltransferase family 2 protein [Anaerolineae bacterium]|nr:glycosyltransferase family 2 protein [Anaerolineae bacterium]
MRLGGPPERPAQTLPWEDMRASVILVSYNDRSHLERSLPSVLSTVTPEDEVIVVDNGSTDGSADWVMERFPAVCLVPSPTNGGFASGCNLGARHARGQYLVFLNPDTAVVSGWLDALLSPFSDPQVALVTPCILRMDDPARINAAGNEVHPTGLAFCRGAGMLPAAFPTPGDVAAISGAAFAVRRDVWEALGGMDESFFLYVEDTDLSWRAWLAGYRCRYVPEPVVYHDYDLRFGEGKFFFQERNRYLLLLKNLRWRTLLLLFPSLLLAEVITWGFLLMSHPHRWREKVRAYLWLFRHGQEIWARRRAAQARRRVRDRDLLARCTPYLAYEQTGRARAARWAHRLLDPLFRLLYGLTMRLVQW